MNTNADPTRKLPHSTSVILSMEELRQIDTIAFQARAIDPLHPLGNRSAIIRYALDWFLGNQAAVQAALAGGDL